MGVCCLRRSAREASPEVLSVSVMEVLPAPFSRRSIGGPCLTVMGFLPPNFAGVLHAPFSAANLGTGCRRCIRRAFVGDEGAPGANVFFRPSRFVRKAGGTSGGRFPGNFVKKPSTAFTCVRPLAVSPSKILEKLQPLFLVFILAVRLL